jgi:DNA-binding transcriptional ArsR family regulator
MVKSAARRKTPPARLDAVFHALSDPTRRSILRGVAERPKTVGEIARPYRVSLAAVSKHLKVLERADLIRREKRGSFQIVRLNAAPMRAAEEWIRHYERFWSRQLDALQDLLDREDSR